MLLQEAIEFQQYYRCYVGAGRDVHIMPYEPRNPHESRYDAHFHPDEKLRKQMTQTCINTMSAMGDDYNNIEFAVFDGATYAIDYLNGAPDAEQSSVGEDKFNCNLTPTPSPP